ncbi:MAG: hypothetical protein LBS42_10915, partial [Tannerella sp.]|nr:hypothetical protein [Tannerella sp.]
NYVQAGQENSFTWAQMKKGLEIQIPLIDSLRKQGKVRVETLETSGRWFREKYPLTPATAVTTLTDFRNQGNKTVWYNSRFYRANLVWEGDAFRFRDIHLFDERMESDYLTKAGTSTQCIYTTLPFVDGFFWSSRDKKAGLRLTDKDGNHPAVNTPVVSELPDNVLQVEFSTVSEQTFKIVFYDDRFEVICTKGDAGWSLELETVPDAELPFRSIENNQIKASWNGFDYSVIFEKGAVEKTDNSVFRIKPSDRKIAVNCSKRI